MSPTSSSDVTVSVNSGSSVKERIAPITSYLTSDQPRSLSQDPRWLIVLNEAFGHRTYALEATACDRICGYLPLAFMKSMLFGRFLVSLPYLNSNGVVADGPEVQTLLIDRAITLADELNVRYLELRHEAPVDHTRFNAQLTSKVHMRLTLPKTTDLLWKSYDPKVRNQVRKGEKNNFTVTWGGLELLEPFYDVLSRNMRDLGTPVYGRRLFRSILTHFPGEAELCVVTTGETPAAAALLFHGRGITEVPTASSLREFNSTCVNMLMYRHLLDRAVERGQAIFDFGRSTIDGPTFKFKKQWGAVPHPATWQYYTRSGAVGEMRPDNPRYQRMIRMWQKLPVRVTQYLGPTIVRGIP